MDQQTQEIRLKHITGTDISAICGVNPYKTGIDVWLEKKKLVEPFGGNLATELGIAKEPVVAKLYATRTGHQLTMSDFISKGIFGGSPDRLCLDDETLGLEIKTHGWRRAVHYGEPGTDAVPSHHLLQCAWYMMLTHRTHWDLAVLLGDDDFRIYTIFKNQKLEDQLKKMAEDWWEKHMIQDQQPDLSGAAGAKQYLEQKYLKNNGKLIPATAESLKLAREYAEVKAALSNFEVKKETLETRLKELTGHYDGISDTLFTFTWKKTKDSKVLDKDELIAALKPTQKQIAKYTQTKEGYRKIFFKHNF